MNKLSLALLSSALFSSNLLAADSITEALTTGTASVNLNLRYESVEQDNALKDATALTLRTRLAYHRQLRGFFRHDRNGRQSHRRRL